MKRMVFLLSAAALWSSAAFAAVIPLEREAWECVNPLGGDFTNGTYVSLHSAAQGFELAKGVPVSSNAAVEAAFTPSRTEGQGFKVAGVSLYEGTGRFWHLALVESPAKHRYFELSEMRDGQWLAHKDLKVEASEKHGQWKTGEKYRLRLALDGKGAEGTVRGEDGRLVFRCRFALKPGAVGCGRPAIKCGSIAGVFSEVRAEHSGPPVQRPSGPRAFGPSGAQTNFYRTARDPDGRWWFVDPDGRRFFLNGTCMVNPAGHHSAALGYAPYAKAVQRKYPTLEDWATNTLARLKSWGFNMLSSSSGELLRRGMPHADVLAMGQSFSECGDEFDILPCDGGPCSGFPNVFHPKWADYCRFVARKCAANRADRWVLGWYIDNELAWWGDRRKFRSSPSRGLFDACARKSPEHTARRALDAFLKERGVASPEAAAEDVAREFIRLVARRYFETAARAIREADPNHLVLGCRFAGLPTSDPVVWEECGRFCDVVTVNTYPLVDLDRGIALNGLDKEARPIADEIAERAKIAGKPVVVTEWSFVALDSGLPCMHGAGQRFFTQGERAKATSILARTLYALPECAGYVYFMWSDQPKVGKRGEKSENCNYGLVDADDNPWPEQVAALSKVQNNPRKWRYAPLPPDRPVARPTAGEVAKKLRVTGSEANQHPDPRFECGEDGSFELSNGLVRLKGKIGEEDVSVDGAGAFSPSIREYARGTMWWSGASRVAEVHGGVKDGVGVMAVMFRGTTAAGAFEMVGRFYLPQGRPFFIADLCDIANRGDRVLPVDAAFFRLVPRDREGVRAAKGDADLEPPKEGQPTPVPPQLWRPWRRGAWVLPDGSCLALAATRLSGVDVKFFKDSNLHADAMWRCPYTKLAPGEAYRPAKCPFVFGWRSASESALEDMSADIQKAVSKCRANATPSASVSSPDGSIELAFDNGPDGMFWSLTRKGKTLVAQSRLGLDFSLLRVRGRKLGEMRVVEKRSRSSDTSWSNRIYRRCTVRDRYNELEVTLEEVSEPHRRLGYVFRAYDEGAAFRYVVPAQEGVDGFELMRELTEWRFPGKCRGWFTSYASEFNSNEKPFELRAMDDVSGDEFVGMPATVEVGGQHVALCEAALANWAGFYFRTPKGGQPPDQSVFEACLTPLPASNASTPGTAVIRETPAMSPWRVAICADTQLDLLNKNDIIANLNPPPEDGLDFSWVKPGATSWDWWVESNNSLTTVLTMRLVDFASEMGWPYHTIDGGWYGFARRPNHGPNVRLEPRKGFDLPKIVEYARKKNVGIWVWIHWQEIDDIGIEETFSRLEKWGVKGVKTDFLDRQDQWIVCWYEKVARAAAKHRVMVNFHGAHRPTGTERTWPNILTREGIMGNEMSKFTAKITPEHCLTLPFTRFLIGPGDFTPGSFANVPSEGFVTQGKRGHRYGDESDQRPIWAEEIGTRAHSIAQCIAFDSYLTTLCDWPQRYRGAAGVEALRGLPTVWKNTTPVEGECGKFYSVVREAYDGRFYFAGLTVKRRRAELKLDFLPEGEWTMDVFADDPARTPGDYKAIRLGTRRVARGQAVSFDMVDEGGAVAIFRKSLP